jgi:ubiquinone biosynthesis protein UbiJ
MGHQWKRKAAEFVAALKDQEQVNKLQTALAERDARIDTLERAVADQSARIEALLAKME